MAGKLFFSVPDPHGFLLLLKGEGAWESNGPQRSHAGVLLGARLLASHPSFVPVSLFSNGFALNSLGSIIMVNIQCRFE